MKPKIWLPIIIVLFLAASGLETPAQTPEKPKISVYFSPNGGCTQAILDEIAKARRQRKETYGIADFLANSGIPTRIDSAHAFPHNKVIVIDEQTVITGSFNFTKSAEDKNAENLLVIKDKGIAMKYAKNWKKHAAHSEPYTGKVSHK
jgi:phosphatidylserine/phosphatidylglycerophosphate/cardiolipin synthase-like enzyme